MDINTLIQQSGIWAIARGGSGNPEVVDIVYDSRNVRPGALYVAIPGTKVHGDSFIPDALTRGAVAILSDNPHPELTVPWVHAGAIRTAPGMLAQTLWRVNTAAMQLVGITGTNGKTSIAHLFEELFLGNLPREAVWMFGTISYHLGGKVTEALHTTPETLDIVRLMGNAEHAPQVVVMEVSSHALTLDRVGGLGFDVAVLTNITQDHLDFHDNMENYYQAKRRLFTTYLKTGGIAVVNIDDPYGRRLAAEDGNETWMTYGTSEDARVRLASWACDWDGCRMSVEYKGKTTSYTSSLCGFFNSANMTALVAGALGIGYGAELIQRAFDKIQTVPGRMERVAVDAPFSVVVDYAHTPDALENVLRAAEEMTSGRLICVFGCGGDRDRTKRPRMGSSVALYCDEAFVTSDNPRSEKPQDIINAIVEGIPLDFPYHTIADRHKAIFAALREARAEDCVVIAGKGHETYQEVAGVKHHFDDKEVVYEYFAQHKGPACAE